MREMVITTRSKRRRLEEENRRQPHQPPPDLISRLPDEVLRAVITLLPSAAEGARTQAVSRRWRPLWSSTPLNLEAKTFTAAQADLASHHGGPCHRLSLTCPHSYYNYFAETEVLRLPSLHGLQEFELFYFSGMFKPVLFNVPRFSPTLRILSVCCCSTALKFPAAEAAAAPLVFQHLKQLTLMGVIIPESTLHGILSGCHALQSLVLHCNAGYSDLRISSRMLRSIGISAADHRVHGEIVIEDAPLLETLFQDGPVYRQKIRVIQAPKLKMLGYLPAENISKEFGPTNLTFEKMELVMMRRPKVMRTVKILALDMAPDNLDVVIDFLTWFPCVEKLYMALDHSKLRKVQGNSNGMRPFVSLECLEEHLMILEFKGYRGLVSEVSLVKFFLKNARVLEFLKFLVARKTCYKKWISKQRHKLRRPGARFCFEPESDHRRPSSCIPTKHIHDLALNDPFDTSSCTCQHDD